MNHLKPFLRCLVLTLPVLVVLLAIVLGTSAVAGAMGDATGRIVLARIALFVAMILATNLVLLIGSLGLWAISGPPPGRRGGPYNWRRHVKRHGGRRRDKQRHGRHWEAEPPAE